MLPDREESLAATETKLKAMRQHTLPRRQLRCCEEMIALRLGAW